MRGLGGTSFKKFPRKKPLAIPNERRQTVGKINVLSFAVANLIAAGEVVDRPSSVIKELLENAIDAGADRITVEIQNGGVSLMRVSDNGCGMSPEDLPVSVRRHATSKIKNAEDLDGILTLGFRGEALAAIASVSDVRIISKTRDAEFGAMLEVSGGEILGVSERGCPDGTTVIVENLFKNVPARRKFLKRDVTEAMAVTAVVEKIALSHPEISVRFICDGNVKMETAGDGILKNTIYSVFGRDYASRMIEVSGGSEGISVKGFIGRSDNVKANRNYQNTFINGRYVRSKTVSAALEQAYTSYISPEKFPCCVLFIDINPQAVDVNVHPAKLEVKFSNEKPVFEAVYYTVRTALENNVTRPEIQMKPIRTSAINAFVPIENRSDPSQKNRQLSIGSQTEYRAGGMSAYDVPEREIVSAASRLYVPRQDEPQKQREPLERDSIAEGNDKILSSDQRERASANDTYVPSSDISAAEETLSVGEPVPARRDFAEEPSKLGSVSYGADTARDPAPAVYGETDGSEESGGILQSYRIVGEVFHTYVIVEMTEEEKFLLIDKHAAHERIIFEKLKAALQGTEHTSQMLMLPVDIMLTSDEVALVEEYRSELEAVGFEFTSGKYKVSLYAIPEGIDIAAGQDMLTVIADHIKNSTGSARLTRDIIFEKALYQASCKAAIKAGRDYASEHIEWIVSQLMKLPDITFCPHGRPVAMQLTKKMLDRQFERT